MIAPAYVRTMAAYNAEMNRRVYDAAARLDDAERRADRGAFWRSIHGTLCHLLWADTVWMARLGLGQAPGVPIAESDRFVADFAELRRRRDSLDAEIVGWAERLEPADLEGDLAWFSGAIRREVVKPRALCVDAGLQPPDPPPRPGPRPAHPRRRGHRRHRPPLRPLARAEIVHINSRCFPDAFQIVKSA